MSSYYLTYLACGLFLPRRGDGHPSPHGAELALAQGYQFLLEYPSVGVVTVTSESLLNSLRKAYVWIGIPRLA